jgi:hypothetical protein
MQTNKSEMHNSKVGLVENSPEIYGQQQGCARVTGQGHHCKVCDRGCKAEGGHGEVQRGCHREAYK